MEKDNYISVNNDQADYSPEIDFKHIAEISPDLISLYDINYRYLYVNPIISSVMGIPREYFIGKSDRDLKFPEEYVEYIEKMIRYVFRTKDTLKIEYSYPTRAGPRWFSSHLFPDVDENNNIKNVISITRDISDQKTSTDVLRIKQDNLEEKILQNSQVIVKMNKQLEEESVEQKRYQDALNSSENKYKQLVDLMQEGIWITDRNGTTTYVNPRMAKILGYSEMEMKDESIFNFIAEENISDAKRYFTQNVEGTAAQFELKCLHKDKSFVTLLLDAHPIYSTADQIIGVIHCVIDITERQKAEEKIRIKEEQIQALFDQDIVGISILAVNGDFLRVNERYCEIMGYSEHELLGMNIIDITALDYISESQDFMAKSIAGEIKAFNFVKQYQRKNQTIIQARASGTLIRDIEGNPKYFIALLQDITSQ